MLCGLVAKLAPCFAQDPGCTVLCVAYDLQDYGYIHKPFDDDEMYDEMTGCEKNSEWCAEHLNWDALAERLVQAGCRRIEKDDMTWIAPPRE